MRLLQARTKFKSHKKTKETVNALKSIQTEIKGVRAAYERRRIQIQKKRFFKDSRWQIILSFFLIFDKLREAQDDNKVAEVMRELKERKLLLKLEKMKEASKEVSNEEGKKTILASSVALRAGCLLIMERKRKNAKNVIGKFFSILMEKEKYLEDFLRRYEKESFFLT